MSRKVPSQPHDQKVLSQHSHDTGLISIRCDYLCLMSIVWLARRSWDGRSSWTVQAGVVSDTDIFSFTCDIVDSDTDIFSLGCDFAFLGLDLHRFTFELCRVPYMPEGLRWPMLR